MPKVTWLVLGIVLVSVALVSALIWRPWRPTLTLRIGDAAPDFTLADQRGVTHTLAQYAGRWLVLYFYPRDDTPGCTREACHFRDDIQTLREVNADVIGISVDSAASHARFAEKYQLPFPLLADTHGDVARAYGALFRLGPLRVARRYTFIVTPQGRLARIYQKVHPAQHAREVAQALRDLQRANARAALLRPET